MVDEIADQKKKEALKSLSTYLSCLLYLRQEAKRDGLDTIAQVLAIALGSIGEWVETGRAPVDKLDLIDSQFCHTIEFLFRWMVLPSSEQHSVLQEISKYEAAITMEKAARHARRASRRTAN